MAMDSVPTSIDPVPAAPIASPTADPFRVLGIVGFVLSFFAVANVVGLVLSLVALIRSARAGYRNRFALAGTIISAIGVLTTIIVVAVLVSTLVGAAQTCAQLGTGVHVVGSATYTCTPTSFYVHYGS
ncbi:DUF4190 domain-containing protein [Microbacterium sp. B19]|uniref:DUF4190 domain-containing protein n=1 Tax=Microbacterium sp. B19 TaxID=96765 RepID=UPI000344C4B3|nr:DUF4190 domain-containing protein [Microbacterium sp. B19]